MVNQWDDYTNGLKDFLKDLQERYQYILMTLYGGTFLSANQQFHAFHLELSDLNLQSFEYLLRLTENEKERVKGWVTETTESIERLLKSGRLQEASIVSNRFFHYVDANMVLSHTEVKEGKSVLYLACLYKYSVLAQQALDQAEVDEQNGKKIIAEIYRQLPLLIHDKDAREINAIPPSYLILRYTQLCLKTNNEESFTVLFDYIKKIIDRIEEQEVYYIGEVREDVEDTLAIFYALASYVEDKQKVPNPLGDLLKGFPLVPKIIKDLKKQYLVTGEKDSFYKALRDLQYGFQIAKVLRPIIRPISASQKDVHFVGAFHFNRKLGCTDTERIWWKPIILYF